MTDFINSLTARDVLAYGALGISVASLLFSVWAQLYLNARARRREEERQWLAAATRMRDEAEDADDTGASR